MPERPLLRLPDPEPFTPRAGPRGGQNVVKPTRGRQQQRIGPRFQRLMDAVERPVDLLALRNDPASIAPERAIVFEVAGALEDFYRQAANVGLEYLGEFESDFPPSADFYDRDDRDRSIGGRIYLALPDIRALQELLSLWRRYQEGRRMPNGRPGWTDLFSRLVDVRPWGHQDRVPPETLAYWREELARHPETPVRFEVELWYYDRDERREASFRHLEQEIRGLNGQIVHHSVIPEIRYNAVLVDLPPAQIQELLDHPDVTLARVDDVMFLRPQSVARAPAKEEEGGEDVPDAGEPVDLSGQAPIAALLDGLPIQNHIRLAGRI